MKTAHSPPIHPERIAVILLFSQSTVSGFSTCHTVFGSGFNLFPRLNSERFKVRDSMLSHPFSHLMLYAVVGTKNCNNNQWPSTPSTILKEGQVGVDTTTHQGLPWFSGVGTCFGWWNLRKWYMSFQHVRIIQGKTLLPAKRWTLNSHGC